jgi:hypothetical protein
LQGLLPICASCKSIRGPEGEWQRIEAYLSANSGTLLTHSLCPSCAAKYLEELSMEPPHS